MAKRTVQRRSRPRPAVTATAFIYRVVIEPDDGRYYAEVPTLPGCHSWGHTYEEALKNIKEALELWLEVKKEDGESFPLETPTTIKNADVTIGVLV